MSWLKQSTVVTVQLGAFLDSTDGVVPETGLATNMDNASTGIRVSKNGATMIDRDSGTAPAHDDDGHYRIELSATDTDELGTLRIQYEESGVATPAWRDFMVVSANTWDTFFGADTLNADLTQMGGVAQSATDLKDFADDGYDPSTDKITGVLLADTVNTLSNLPSIPANWLTATGINAAAFTESKFGADFLTSAKIADDAFLAVNFAASSLDGKGDWNLGKSGYALTTADWNVGKSGYSLTTADWNVGKTGYTLGTDGLTAAAVSTAALDKIVDQTWDELLAGHVIGDSAGLLMNDWQDGGRLDIILDTLALEATVAGLNNVSTADILTQVNAALDATISELGVAPPAATPTLRTGLMLIYMALRNARATTVSTDIITNDAGTTICSATVSDDAVTFDKTEYA